MAWDGKVAFIDNHMAHYQIVPGTTTYGRHVVVWRENVPFSATMYIHNYYGVSGSVRFILTDEHNVQYNMFCSDMFDMLRRGNLVEGYIHGKWMFCKKGTKYGVKYIGI
jgi:hypothetical protein